MQGASGRRTELRQVTLIIALRLLCAASRGAVEQKEKHYKVSAHSSHLRRNGVLANIKPRRWRLSAWGQPPNLRHFAACAPIKQKRLWERRSTDTLACSELSLTLRHR